MRQKKIQQCDAGVFVVDVTRATTELRRSKLQKDEKPKTRSLVELTASTTVASQQAESEKASEVNFLLI